jgi:hypothetical protein
MKFNHYKAEWTNTGAVVLIDGFAGITMRCLRCDTPLTPGVEHRCGDRVPPPIGKRKKVKA